MLTLEVEKEVLNLNPEDKIHLAEMILDSLAKPDSKTEKKWVKESESRYAAYKKNRTSGIPLSEIKKRYEK
jgi:putative addiction module component (TIGR02574 family)